MTYQLILDRNLLKLIESRETKIDAFVTYAFEHSFVTEPVPVVGYEYRMRKHFEPPVIGEAVCVESPSERYDRILITTVPKPTEADFETTKKCYLSCLIKAAETGAKKIIIPPFYAANITYNATAVYEAMFDAFDIFDKEYDIPLEAYVILRSWLRHNEVCDRFKKEFRLGINGFIKDNPDDWQEKLSQMEDNVEPFEKMLRIMARQNLPEANSKRKERRQSAPNFSGAKLCKYINGYIERHKISKSKFARMICVYPSTVTDILNKKGTQPRIGTAIAMSIVLELSDDERTDFMSAAGYRYPDCPRDDYVEDLYDKGIRDIEEINDRLYALEPSWMLTANEHKTKINNERRR